MFFLWQASFHATLYISLNGTNSYPNKLILTTWTHLWLHRWSSFRMSTNLRCNVVHHSKCFMALTRSFAYLFGSIFSFTIKFLSPKHKNTFPQIFQWKRKEQEEMASGFPPQKQETQPGVQHVMDPSPQFSSPNYKPSNKLHVIS